MVPGTLTGVKVAAGTVVATVLPAPVVSSADTGPAMVSRLTAAIDAAIAVRRSLLILAPLIDWMCPG